MLAFPIQAFNFEALFIAQQTPNQNYQHFLVLKINFHYECKIVATKKYIFRSSKDVFLFPHFYSSFSPMKSFISENVLNTSCETCNAVFSFPFFHSGLFLLFLSSALDNNLEYLNVLFAQKFLDSSFTDAKCFQFFD